LDCLFYIGTLGVIELYERHTGEYISQVFSTVLSQWGINVDQVIAIVTDNGIFIQN